MSCRHIIDATLGWHRHGARAQQGLRACSASFSDQKARAMSERVHEHPLVESVTCRLLLVSHPTWSQYVAGSGPSERAAAGAVADASADVLRCAIDRQHAMLTWSLGR